MPWSQESGQGFPLQVFMNEPASVVRIKKRVLSYLGSQKKECTQCEIYDEVIGRRDVIARALSCTGDGVRCDPRRYILNVGNHRRALNRMEIRNEAPQLESLTDNMEILAQVQISVSGIQAVKKILELYIETKSQWKNATMKNGPNTRKSYIRTRFWKLELFDRITKRLSK